MDTVKLDTIKFGEHLIFDAYGCDYASLSNSDLCKEILNKIVDLAEMHKISDPLVVKASDNVVLGGKDPGGFSGFVLIQESHVSIHTFAKRGFVTIDVYSCKEFIHVNEIVLFLINTFKPKDYTILKMDRGMKYPTENIY